MKSFDFTISIFEVTNKSSINRNIVNQLERVSLSISNNIAEGFKLQSNRHSVSQMGAMVNVEIYWL